MNFSLEHSQGPKVSRVSCQPERSSICMDFLCTRMYSLSSPVEEKNASRLIYRRGFFLVLVKTFSVASNGKAGLH